MGTPHDNDQISDDEIFFGRLTLKEIKKHVLWDKNHQLSPYPDKRTTKQEDHDESLKLIKTHSQPNLLTTRDHNSPAKSLAWEDKISDDSFVNIENIVDKLCMSTGHSEPPELNNTLEVIDYILNNGPPKAVNKNIEDFATPNFSPKKVYKLESDIVTGVIKSPSPCHPPVKIENDSTEALPQTFSTPAKTVRTDQPDVYATPLSEIKPISLFKTPAQPRSLKKPSATSLKKTPSRTNAYQHITSPIASYINQSPRVPLVKDVHPRKPLPSSSSIPKLQKSTTKPKLSNKENINLPSIAYKSAIKTRVINVPDEEKLPQSQWIKKVTSSLPRPVVMKHDHREHNLAKKQLTPQEDSFADLTYHQADVSVCTQKSAFKLNKKF